MPLLTACEGLLVFQCSEKVFHGWGRPDMPWRKVQVFWAFLSFLTVRVYSMAQTEKKGGLLRKSSASKKPLKEKVVLMYDEIFTVRSWASLFFYRVVLNFLDLVYAEGFFQWISFLKVEPAQCRHMLQAHLLMQSSVFCSLPQSLLVLLLTRIIPSMGSYGFPSISQIAVQKINRGIPIECCFCFFGFFGGESL